MTTFITHIYGLFIRMTTVNETNEHTKSTNEEQQNPAKAETEQEAFHYALLSIYRHGVATLRIFLTEIQTTVFCTQQRIFTNLCLCSLSESLI